MVIVDGNGALEQFHGKGGANSNARPQITNFTAGRRMVLRPTFYLSRGKRTATVSRGRYLSQSNVKAPPLACAARHATVTLRASQTVAESVAWQRFAELFGPVVRDQGVQ